MKINGMIYDVWLDDLRKMRTGYNLHVKSAWELIDLVKSGQVRSCSLDHDLGNDKKYGTGYDVTCFIEEYAYNGGNRIVCKIHSANPVGVEKMKRSLINAERYWNSSNH